MLDDIFDQAAQQADIDPRLLKTVGMLESSLGKNTNASIPGDPDSPVGFFQMRPSTAQSVLGRQPQTLADQATGAAKYLREGLDKTGTPQGALAYYFAGPDQSGWGPKTAAYVAKGQQYYGQMTVKPSARTTPTVAKDDADPYVTAGAAVVASPGAAVTAAANRPSPAPSALDDADPYLEKGAAIAQQDTASTKTSTSDQPLADTFGPLAADAADQNLAAARKTYDAKSTEQVVQDVIAPDPNATYGSVVPLARDNATGALRVALPSSMRSVLQGAAELSQGPATGTVTPAGTNALLALATSGAGGSVANGTTALVGNRLLAPGSAALGRNEAPNLIGVLREAPSIASDSMVPSAIGPTSAVPVPLMDQVLNRLAGVKAATEPGAAPIVNKLTGGNVSEPPAPPNPEPSPSPSGAAAQATTRSVAPTDPAALAAYEQARLATPRVTQAGFDSAQYVPGSKPTLAEVSGKVEDANDQRFFANQPDTKAPFRQVQTDNNTARVSYLNDVAGTRQTLANAEAARDAQAQKDLAAAWGGKTQSDAQPVVDQIDKTLAGPAGKLSAVDGALTKIRGKLFNADGQLETDPEVLYGVRQEVANLLGKNAQSETPTLKNAARQLTSLKDTLDGQIEQGAPGYQQYLSNYSTASRPIDSMELLQDALPRLQVGADKKLTFNGFNNFMKGIVDARQASGVNQAKSLDPDTMDRLWNVYADLHRSQQAENIGGTAGSSTVPWASQALKFGAEGAGHLAAAVVTGGNPMANMLLRGAVSTLKTARNGSQKTNRVNALLDGSNYQP